MMPLLAFRAHAAGVQRRLMPRVLVQGEAFVVHAHQAAAVELCALDTVISGV